FEGRARQLTPDSAFPVLASPENPLPDVASWRNPEFAKFDIPASDFLKSKGINEAGIRTIDQTFNANSVESYYMLNEFRTIESYRQVMALGPVGYLVTVTQSLPEAMAKAMPRAVEMYKEIARIDVSENGVEIETEVAKVWRAAQVIFIVPL